MVMLKRFSSFVAYVLLVLMPLQALATANMLVCHSVMQANTIQYTFEGTQQSAHALTSTKSCHQHMAMKDAHPSKSKAEPTSSCKSNCASHCVNLCALTAMLVQSNTNFSLNLTQAFDLNHQLYASISQPNLQRPPITFI